MRKNSLDGIELSITITTSNHSPTNLNLKFLIDNQIIPYEWNNGQQVVCKNDISQIVFDDRINIISSNNKINFVEDINYKPLIEINSPVIAMRYAETLAKFIDINYFNVDISFKGYIVYPQNSGSPHRYIFETLVCPPIQEWTEVEDANLQGSLSFFYSFKNRELKLSIDEAMLKTAQAKESPILLFTGDFNYNISNNNSKLDIKDCRAIAEWFNDLEIYWKLINRFVNLIP